MVVTHRSILAGAVMLLAGTAAASADYYGGMKEAPIATFQPASWYVRGDFSYSWMDAQELNGANPPPFGSVSIGDTWALGGGIGYYFGRGFRGDVTYDWRDNARVHGGGPLTTDFDLKSSLILANLYYDFRPYERFTPYVGLGVGAAYHSTGGGTITGCGGCGPYDGGSNWSAAGAVMAGLSLRIDRGGHHVPISIKDQPVAAEPGRLHLDVGYRFLYLGDAHTGGIIAAATPTPGPRIDDITAHEIRVGLRWDIR
jgi:opacity protein-like surface antigen